MRAYKGDLGKVAAFLNARSARVSGMMVSDLSEDDLVSFFVSLKSLSYSTVERQRCAVVGWCRYLEGEGLRTFDISRLNRLIKPYLPEPIVYTRSQPNPYDLSRVIEHAMRLAHRVTDNEGEHLRQLRDRALIILLVDTGLEVSALQELCRGDVNPRQRTLTFRSNGSGDTSVALTSRATRALQDYLDARAGWDKGSGRNVARLPLFVGHRPDQKGEEHPLTVSAIRKIVISRAAEVLGDKYGTTISPGALRHYHVDALLEVIPYLHPRVVEKCEGLIRDHHYDEAIFNAMKLVEEEIRSRAHAENTDIGLALVSRAMQAKPPEIPAVLFSTVPAEQEAAHSLFRGALGTLKNPLSHRFVEVSDLIEALERVGLASLLLRMLDRAENPG